MIWIKMSEVKSEGGGGYMSTPMLNHYLIQTLFCSYLQQPGLLALAVCFDTIGENMIAFLFDLWAYKTKAAHDEETLLKLKVCL